MNTQAFDIAIRRARLRGSAVRNADIGITDGRIAAIAPRLDGSAATEIDARGNLVTESFVNPHLHLCEVWTLPMMEEEALRAYQGEGMGKALSGIEFASRRVDRGVTTPELKAAWQQGRKELFYPYGKTYAQAAVRCSWQIPIER